MSYNVYHENVKEVVTQRKSNERDLCDTVERQI